MFRVRQSSFPTTVPCWRAETGASRPAYCGAIGPCSRASTTPDQGVTGWGARHRKFPAGTAAYRTPRQAKVLSGSHEPTSSPAAIRRRVPGCAVLACARAILVCSPRVSLARRNLVRRSLATSASMENGIRPFFCGDEQLVQDDLSLEPMAATLALNAGRSAEGPHSRAGSSIDRRNITRSFS